MRIIVVKKTLKNWQTQKIRQDATKRKRKSDFAVLYYSSTNALKFRENATGKS